MIGDAQEMPSTQSTILLYAVFFRGYQVSCYVEQIMELSNIRATESVASIQKWAQLAFQDRTTGRIDEMQQSPFEVITSIFGSTFHEMRPINTVQISLYLTF
jgi:hypothetical protein